MTKKEFFINNILGFSSVALCALRVSSVSPPYSLGFNKRIEPQRTQWYYSEIHRELFYIP